MAAEYSRQLSEKVFHGSAKVSEKGYSAGGTACYGLGRLLLNEELKPIRILKRGEHKQISNERVTFVPLENEETKIVKTIFQRFVEDNSSPAEVAHELNRQGYVSASGGKWDRNKVLRILSNEVYAGTRIYNKTANRLKTGKRKNPRGEWVICPNAFPAIIDKTIFLRAQEKLYWYTLKQWKVGMRAIRQARELAQHRILETLTTLDLAENLHSLLLDRFPLVLSIGIAAKQGALQWCFIVPENLRQYSTVLGLGLVATTQDPVKCIFHIPTKKVGIGGAIVLNNKEAEYLVAPEQVDSVIAALLQEEINLSFPQPEILHTP